MKIIKTAVQIVFFTSTLTGCSAFSPRDLAEPSELEIDVVMGKIGTGFANMKAELNKGNTKLGIWPCKVTTTLNVTASAEQGGKLVLDTTIRVPTEVVNADISGHAEQTNNSSATRGNVINIEMYNPACVPKDTVAYQIASSGNSSAKDQTAGQEATAEVKPAPAEAKPSPAKGKPGQAKGKPAPAKGKPAPANGQAEPASGQTGQPPKGDTTSSQQKSPAEEIRDMFKDDREMMLVLDKKIDINTQDQTRDQAGPVSNQKP
ncbi:hypothetical protein ACH50O_02920 [Methylomonas sp. 2BW1-5-20]|uniref:hypothetical protein n=1 Tax=Methylomonas sp. 2BW1-5-20 TaxID=3376686 RepID=UPI00404D021C